MFFGSEKGKTMDELISRKALLDEYDRVHIGEPGKARKLIEDAPAVDAVSRGVLDQVRWERDIALEQLADYGLSLGERADVVKVVRCKYCKHRYTTFRGLSFCTYHLTMSAKDNAFCSDGERKDNDST